MSRQCYGVEKLAFGLCREPNNAVELLGKAVCGGCFSEVNRLAFTDQLTGLPNRYALEKYFGDLISQHLPIGAISVDVENFKKVNDTLGHKVGDGVLQYTGLFLPTHLRTKEAANKPQRPTDKIFAARRGGDEFAILVPLIDKNNMPLPLEAQPSALRLITRRLKSGYSKDPIIDTYNEFVGPSFALGLRLGSLICNEEMDLETLLAGADPKGHEALPEPIPELTLFADAFMRKLNIGIETSAKLVEHI
jgi:diguanylate cyclase (GGDEF)-like protein